MHPAGPPIGQWHKSVSDAHSACRQSHDPCTAPNDIAKQYNISFPSNSNPDGDLCTTYSPVPPYGGEQARTIHQSVSHLYMVLPPSPVADCVLQRARSKQLRTRGLGKLDLFTR